MDLYYASFVNKISEIIIALTEKNRKSHCPLFFPYTLKFTKHLQKGGSLSGAACCIFRHASNSAATSFSS